MAPILGRGTILGSLKAEVDCSFCVTVQSIISGFTLCDVYSLIPFQGIHFCVQLHFYGTWGSVVVKALRYCSEGPGIDSQWCRWGFFPWYPRGRLSLWKWVPEISPRVKAAGTFGWRPTILVVPKRQEIRGLNLPGTPWATSACRGSPLLYFTATYLCPQ